MTRARCGIAAMLILALGASPAVQAQVVDAKFELFVSDPAASVAFYQAIGFDVAHRKADDYTTLRSGSVVVALSPLPGWLPLWMLGFLRHPPLGTEIVFYTDELEALREALVSAGYDPGPIALQSWGDRDFRITDPDGYYVRVSEGRALPGVGRALPPDDETAAP